jgi:hypothetical protein
LIEAGPFRAIIANCLNGIKDLTETHDEA